LAGRLTGRYRTLPIPLSTGKSGSPGTSDGDLSSNQTEKYGHLHSTFDWTPGVSRSVDLEGIANDGFGYTVNVTGAGQAQQAPSNGMWRVPSFHLRGKRKNVPEVAGIKDALAIPITTELDVSETWKAPVEKVIEVVPA
jgi:hypothetical protein